jgi:hypothetical protein
MTLITTAFGQMLLRRPMKVGTSRIDGLASFTTTSTSVTRMVFRASSSVEAVNTERSPKARRRRERSDSSGETKSTVFTSLSREKGRRPARGTLS